MNSQNYFDRIAPQWNAMRQRYFNQDIRPIIFSRIDFKNTTVADLGAGTGYLALELAKHAKIVFAIDQSLNMLDQIKEKAHNHKIDNIYTLASDIQSIPFQSSQIDIVTMNMALHHMLEPNLIIKEMYRLLNDNGIAVISDVMSHNGKWAIEEMHDVWLGFSKNQIEYWLSENGFIDIEFIETNFQAIASNQNGETINPNIFIVIAKKGKKNED